jgi:transcriptional repressor NrdR
LIVIKRNGKKIPFDRDKLSKSLLMALRKRQTDDDAIEKAINGIVRQLESRGDNDIHSKLIGELVMNALAQIDNVAYIRYASVYRNFREASDFGKFVEKEIKD